MTSDNVKNLNMFLVKHQSMWISRAPLPPGQTPQIFTLTRPLANRAWQSQYIFRAKLTVTSHDVCKGSMEWEERPLAVVWQTQGILTDPKFDCQTFPSRLISLSESPNPHHKGHIYIPFIMSQNHIRKKHPCKIISKSPGWVVQTLSDSIGLPGRLGIHTDWCINN